MSPDPVHPNSVPKRQCREEASEAVWEQMDRDVAKAAGWTTEPFVPVWKRYLDVTVAGIATLILSPLLVAIALWVKLVSRGSVLFRQERVGLGGKVFVLYKFRSMQESATTDDHERYVGQLMEDDVPMTKMDELGDRRMIPGGIILRALGMDELPQLINVFRGEMSIVGPRPCLPSEAARYQPEQRERFNTLPGLTGYWQVNGKNRTTFSEMNAMDIHYVRNKALRMDLLIILRTPFSILGQVVASYAANKPSLPDEDREDPVPPAPPAEEPAN